MKLVNLIKEIALENSKKKKQPETTKTPKDFILNPEITTIHQQR